MKHILILTYWSYQDALIQAYTLPYVRMIKKSLPAQSKIFLVTAEQARFRMTQEEIAQHRHDLQAEGIEWRPLQYVHFGWRAVMKRMADLLRLFVLCLTAKISYIHAWCTPAGVTGYLLSLFTGIPLIIDSYEPHAEAMVENGTWKRGSWSYRILIFFERLMSKRARWVIAASAGMREYARKRYGVEFKRFYVKPACVDLNKFSILAAKDSLLLKKLNLEGKIVCVYAGKIGGIYLEQEIFDFFKAAYDHWGNRLRILLLTDTDQDKLKHMAAAVNLPETLLISQFIPHKNIPLYLGLGDFALNPVKPVPTKRYCTSIKDGEYWAMGLPVVITPGISDDSDIIEKENIGAVIKYLSVKGYKEAVIKIDSLLKIPFPELKHRIIKIAEIYRHFRIAEKVYAEIYKQ